MFLRKILQHFKTEYITLGRWNSVIKNSSFDKTNNKELWEKYVDMANMDNCCSDKLKLHSFLRDIK